MTILLPLICIVYGIPILVVLSSLIRLYIQNKANSSLLLIIFVLSLSVWLFSSLPWQLDLNVEEEVVQILFKIGVICGSVGLITLMMIFSRSYISYKVSILARIAITFYLIVIGIAISSIAEPENEFYNLIRVVENWEATYHPLIFYIINLAHLFFLASLVLGVRDLNSLPEHLMEPRNKTINTLIAFTFVITLITNSLFFILDPIYGIISRLMVILIVLFLAYYVAHEPIMVFFDISNPKKIIKEGYIGYSLSALTQLGPSPIHYSEAFNNRFKIEASEMVTNSILSLTVVSSSKDLEETVIMLPFAKKDDIVSLNISFTMYDPTFDDPRHNNMNMCVIAILIPYFKASLRNVKKLQAVIRTELEKIPELSKFTEENLVEIVAQALTTIELV